MLKMRETKDRITGLPGLKKINMTPQRRKILQIFEQNPHQHLNAEDVYAILRREDEDERIGLATVYRSLSFLMENGLLTSIELNGVNCFELNKATPDHPHQHHHLICMGCGKVIEVDSPLTGKIEQTIQEKTGFKVQDHQLKFFGYCEECQKKMEEEKEKEGDGKIA